MTIGTMEKAGSLGRGVSSRRLLRWAPLLVVAGLGSGCDRAGTGAVEPPVIWGGPCDVDRPVDGRFARPRAIACAPDGSVYVADFTGRIQKFDSTGEFLWTRRLSPFLAGKPAGLGVAANGDLLVGETHAHRVSRFSPQGHLLERWGTYGREPGRLLLVRDVTGDADGNVYVADYGYVEAVGLLSRIQKFSADGNLLMPPIGAHGGGPGELDRPEALALDADGHIYVCDTGNHRVQVFSPSGRLLRAWGGRGQGPGQFDRPYDIAVSPRGFVYVADRDNHRVQVFTGDGRFVTAWGSLGTARHHLAAPWGVAVDPGGVCFICDTGNQRIVRVHLHLPAPQSRPAPATGRMSAEGR